MLGHQAGLLLQHPDEAVREVRVRRMSRHRKPVFESGRVRLDLLRRQEAAEVERVVIVVVVDGRKCRTVADVVAKVRLWWSTIQPWRCAQI